MLSDQGRRLFADATSSGFAPSYEWKDVGESQSVPPGLEVRLPLGGGGAKMARIPPRWQMRVWVGEPVTAYARVDVQRGTLIRDVVRDINAFVALSKARRRVELVQLSTGRPLPLGETVESVGLFSLQNVDKDLAVRWA